MPDTNAAPGGPSADPVLDAEKLDAYHVALEFQAVVSRWLARTPASLRDQLDRASVSIVLNMAEAAGRRTGPDKARLFDIARGSATEAAALLDLLKARSVISASDHLRSRALIVRTVQMLTRLSTSSSGRRRVVGDGRAEA